MKKQFLLLVLLVSIGSHLSAQLSIDKLDYSNYLPDEQRYRLMNYNVTFDPGIDDDLGLERSRLDILANLNTFRNTNKTQTVTSATGGIRRHETAGLTFFANYQFASKTYAFKKIPKLFTVFDFDVSLLSSGGGAVGPSHSFGLSGGGGYGRISVLNEVEIAERLLDALSATTNEEVVFALADKLTKIKNKRYFTNREDWLGGYEELEIWLEENGYVVESEKAQNALKDIFETEALIKREEGSVFSAVAKSRFFQFSNFHRFDIDETGLTLSYDYKKYLSANKQWNTSITTSLNLNEKNRFTSTDLISEDYNSVNFGVSSTLHQLINKDARFSTTLFANYTKAFDYVYNREPYPEFEEILSGYTIGTNLEYERRFGRNTRVALGLDLSYSQRTKVYAGLNLKVTF